MSLLLTKKTETKTEVVSPVGRSESPTSEIQKIMESPEYKAYHMYGLAELTEHRDCYEITLPNANGYWSISAWKLATMIYEKYHYYPCHNHRLATRTNIILNK